MISGSGCSSATVSFGRPKTRSSMSATTRHSPRRVAVIRRSTSSSACSWSAGTPSRESRSAGWHPLVPALHSPVRRDLDRSGFDHPFAPSCASWEVTLRLRCLVLAGSAQKGSRSGERREHTFRYTDLWLRGNAGWLLAVRHASIVRPA
jgi:hypothetical protein